MNPNLDRNFKVKRSNRGILLLLFLFMSASLLGVSYPDQHYVIQGADWLLKDAETVSGIVAADDGKAIILADSVLAGYLVGPLYSSAEPFNRGLPSWNGRAPTAGAAFKVQMRFPDNSDWSPWLTVGFWKENIWSSYGYTSYDGGRVDIDYVKLYSYQSGWQFKIIMKRNSLDSPSPTLSKLSFFVSDTRTTNEADHTAIYNDKPEAIFIPTTFLHQYSLDPVIGKSICSPTSVSMILLSYGIAVDPVQFARDTRDPYWEIFGDWPRVVQNASEYGLDGAVTRYRTWSDAYAVLAAGGRIAMSVGPPLYSGHLMMLAGFDQHGNPLVHDPARSNGYSYQFSKSKLDSSWFDKGGIAYTFYLRDSAAVAISAEAPEPISVPAEHRLIWNYPNPFNNTTEIHFIIKNVNPVTLEIYNLRGASIKSLIKARLTPGHYQILWDGTDQKNRPLGSGVYFVLLTSDNNPVAVARLLLLK